MPRRVWSSCAAMTAARDHFHRLRDARWSEVREEEIPWLRFYHNTCNHDDFAFFMGLTDEADRERLGRDPYALEEYLSTGLDDPIEMSAIASYHRYLCKRLDIAEAAAAQPALTDTSRRPGPRFSASCGEAIGPSSRGRGGDSAMPDPERRR